MCNFYLKGNLPQSYRNSVLKNSRRFRTYQKSFRSFSKMLLSNNCPFLAYSNTILTSRKSFRTYSYLFRAYCYSFLAFSNKFRSQSY